MKDQHKKFAQLYATPGTKCFRNATQSYIGAGYSEKSAVVNGCHLLKREDVQREVEKIEQELSLLTNISPEWIKSQCYLMYDSLKDSRPDLAKQYLELAGKCVGAFKASPDIDEVKTLEPIEPEDRKSWLESELALLDEQDQAGTGLPD